jgi:hypothetical protein
MVGYRSNVKALSRMHLFNVVASVPEVNEATVRGFSRQASDYAKGQKVGCQAMVQPAVVDLTEGRVHTFQGRRLWGAAFAGYLRKKRALYLPDPG